MAFKELVALTLLTAASPVTATVQEPAGAPAGNPNTLYRMHIEAVTGSRLGEVKCWTRAEWAERGVDVDKDWAREGVSVIG